MARASISGIVLCGGALLACTLLACESRGASRAAAESAAPLPPDTELASDAARAFPTFDRYWYRGAAELSRFALSQSRYGAVHEGEAVLIFVTEPFDTQRQVKHERGEGGPEVQSVLKLNAYRRFYTGVYPYSLLTSSFVPAAGDVLLPFKVSFSAQEWCGHVFSQLNRRGGQYEVHSFSYFEAEGDQRARLPETWSEDGLWAVLRRDPAALPIGAVSVVPALHHVRMHHERLQAEAAHASLSKAHEGVRTYRLRYESGRVLHVQFEARFPYGIVSFTEEPGGGLPPTHARRTKALVLPYWQKNRPEDAAYRQALGLTQ